MSYGSIPQHICLITYHGKGKILKKYKGFYMNIIKNNFDGIQGFYKSENSDENKSHDLLK